MSQDTDELPISLPPGVVKTDSQRVIEGRWLDTINARFKNRLPQKIGGWVKAYAQATMGVPRTLFAWRDTAFNAYLAVGTFIKLYVYDQNLAQQDITPFRSTGTLPNNPLAVSAGSNVVQVTQNGHGLSQGDLIILTGATAVGGITPNVSEVPVNTVIDANNYTYVFPGGNATSSITGGGNAILFSYEIPVGVELGTYGYGWGVGGWGLGTWGTARSTSTVQIEPRVWSLDKFGVLLLAAYNGGTIYQFDPTQNQPWPRATVISTDPGLPTNVRAMLVTNERFVMALCAGMQIAWASQSSLTVWTPANGNTANIRTLTEGTKLVSGAVLGDFVFLVWSDSAVYLFQYNGSIYVYASSMIAKDCGLISPNAKVTAGGAAYWMGQNTFWQYNGAVQPMANVEDIRKWLFDQIDINMGYQATAVYNPVFNEIWFFVTLLGQTTPTLGVIYSVELQCWAPLYWGRAGGTHFTQGDTRPYMGDVSGFIYQHENTNDADGAILPYSMTMSPYALSKGGKWNMTVEYIVPDFFDQIGDITQVANAYDRVNDSAPIDTETDTIIAVDNGTVDMHLGGRYIGIIWSQNSLGSYVRMGLPVAFVRRIGDRS